MAKGQKGQLVTKKHLARQERERRQNRIYPDRQSSRSSSLLLV